MVRMTSFCDAQRLLLLWLATGCIERIIVEQVVECVKSGRAAVAAEVIAQVRVRTSRS